MKCSYVFYGSFIGALLWIVPFFAADEVQHKGKKYKGDAGNLILELVLKNTPPPMSGRTLKSLMKVSKHVSDCAKEQVQLCAKFLRKWKSKNSGYRNGFYSSDGLAVGILDGANFCTTLSCISPAGGEVMHHAGVEMRFSTPVTPPFFINDMCCLACESCDPANLLRCIDTRTGKCYPHPFSQDIVWGSDESRLLGALVEPSDTLNRQYQDIARKLAPAHIYTVLNQLVFHWPMSNIVRSLAYCYGGEKMSLSHGLQGKTWRLSLVQDAGMIAKGRKLNWAVYRESFVLENESHTSHVLQATCDYIQWLKEKKIFVSSESAENAPGFAERVKLWKQAVDYLGKRFLVKTCNNHIMRYDILSNTVRVFTLYEAQEAKKHSNNALKRIIKSISKSMVLPNTLDVDSLTLTHDGYIKYMLQTNTKWWIKKRMPACDLLVTSRDKDLHHFGRCLQIPEHENQEDEALSSDEYV